MKNLRATFSLLLVGVGLHAQDLAPAPAADSPPVPNPSASATRLTAEQLDQLLAPIALYPDPLLALILPASTVPTDIVLAARMLRDNPGDRTQIEHRAWDDSVKSLTNYPDVVKWMDENLQWTQQLGEAFAQQPTEVMEAVQRLRAKARANGTLVDTPQQQVIAEPQVIRIVPAQPDVIYVPYYQPDVVFVDRPVYYGSPFVSFGFGFPVGSWLAFECDWHRHTIWVGNRHRPWSGHDWHQPLVVAPASRTFVARSSEVRQWRPPPQAPRVSVAFSERFRSGIARPMPFGGTSPHYNAAVQRPPVVVDAHRSQNGPSAASVSAPTVSSQPQPVSRGYRRDYSGPRTSAETAATAPQAVTANPPAPTPAPTVQSQPVTRRSGIDWSRDTDPQVRHNRGQTSTAPANSVVTPVPTSPPPVSPSVGTAPQRSYSYSRGATAPASAPNVAPSYPAVNRASAPAMAAPPPPPAVVQPAPQPAQAAPQHSNNGGDNRGQSQAPRVYSRGGRDDAAR